MAFGPLIGAVQLAVGRGVGIARFGDSVPAFMASLAPLIAFPVVGAAALAMTGAGGQVVLAVLLLTAVAQLAPAVLSHWLAVRWGREAQWLRYATAFNWCQLTIPVAALVMLVVVQIGTAGALPEGAAKRVLTLMLAGYVLWLNWTIARHGLALSRKRAAGLVALVNVGTIVLIVGPGLVVQLVG